MVSMSNIQRDLALDPQPKLVRSFGPMIKHISWLHRFFQTVYLIFWCLTRLSLHAEGDMSECNTVIGCTEIALLSLSTLSQRIQWTEP